MWNSWFIYMKWHDFCCRARSRQGEMPRMSLGSVWLFCRSLKNSGSVVEGFGQGSQLGLGAGGVGGFDGFIDAGDDDGGVAGELAGRVDGVAIPGSLWQASGVEEGFFRVAQGLVERRGVGRGWGLRCGDGFARGGEAVGGGESRGEIESELLFGGAVLSGVEVAEDLLAVELVVVGENVGVGHVEDFE